MRYQEHTDYATHKRQADLMYRRLTELKGSDDDDAIQSYYRYLKGTKLYKQAGGLYCQILCDVEEA